MIKLPPLPDDGGELVLFIDDIKHTVEQCDLALQKYSRNRKSKERADFDRMVTKAQTAVNKYNKEAEMANEDDKKKYGDYVQVLVQEIDNIRERFDKIPQIEEKKQVGCASQ
jgi:hypothetical protein